MPDAAASLKPLASVLTDEEPLGPRTSDSMARRHPDAFADLYEEANGIHRLGLSRHPSYIVGRKGAGKTAFLLGLGLREGIDVLSVRSENVYQEADRVRRSYQDANELLPADSFAHVWSVLLHHVAMRGVCQLRDTEDASQTATIWTYLTNFGDPREIELDRLLALVSGNLMQHFGEARGGRSFREMCEGITFPSASYQDARAALRLLLKGRRRPIAVVVDNLEDLHTSVDVLAPVLRGLFRLVGDAAGHENADDLPFRVQFAFPSELLHKLRVITANPDKDFHDYLLVTWTAAELILFAGNRLEKYAALQDPSAVHALDLPRPKDRPADHSRAESTLRAFLPPEIENGIGGREDSLGYILRHTQLLPRHLVQMLNEVLGPACSGVQKRPATPAEVVDGVMRAEKVIVQGILASYSFDTHQFLGSAIEHLKNEIPLVLTVSELHKIFGKAGGKKSGLDFDQFLDAALAAGALGIKIDETDRYHIAEYSYTVQGHLGVREGRDVVCVHPLFSNEFCGSGVLRSLRSEGAKPVYPYGSGPEAGRLTASDIEG